MVQLPDNILITYAKLGRRGNQTNTYVITLLIAWPAGSALLMHNSFMSLVNCQHDCFELISGFLFRSESGYVPLDD